MTAIKDIADRSCMPGKPVGILTGNDRNTWAKDHSLLLGFFQFTFVYLYTCIASFYLTCFCL